MLAQAAQRLFRGARAPLSPWAQPFAALHASAQSTTQLPRTAQTDAARFSPRSQSVLRSKQIAPGPRYPLPQLPLTPSPFSRSTRRPFSSGSRSQYGYNQYNRFSGPGRGSLFYALIQRAKARHFVIIGVGIWGVWFYNTDVVTETGRRRFICVSPQRELAFGEQGYREALHEARGKILPDYHPQARMVDRVLQRLIPQAPIQGADWKVHVIKDDSNVNAFVLPGGKVFVYTGILPICGDEDGLAAVLGHEIAHVVARHPAERMSNSFLTLGAVFMISLLFDVSGQFTSLLVNLMYGLPNSRSQEAEADNIGLMMMSRACFKPEAAVKLWARMQKQEKMAPPQFMSTHPSSYNREEAIRGWLAKAQDIYEDNGCSSLGRYVPGFHDAYRTHSTNVW